MWLNKYTQGIRFKLMIPGALALLVVVVIIEWVFVPLHVNDRRAHLKQDQSEMLNVVASTLLEDILSGNLGHIYSVLDNAITVNSTWKGVALTDQSGIKLYPAHKLKETVVANKVLIHPILFGGRPIGNITLYYDDAQELREEKTEIQNIGIWVLATIFIALIVNYLWQDRVLRNPIHKLLNMANMLSEGNFTRSITVAGSDEIGQLGSAMEYLRANLVTVTEHMHEHSEHTQAILENVGEGIITIDEYGIINSFNSAACHIFGYETSEVVGMNINMLLPEPHRSRHDGYLANYLRTGKKNAIGRWLENFGVRSNGEQFPIKILISEIERQGRKIFIGVVRDITERKATERALYEARDRAQNYLDVASVMLFSLDKQGCVTMLNRAGCTITGCTFTDLQGRNWFDTCVPASDRHELRNYYAEVMAGKEPLYKYLQVKLINKKNEVRSLYLYGSLLQAGDGGISGVIFSGEDITEQRLIISERKQFQQQLVQAQKMEAIGQLTGGIAHDFNNMLAGVLGFAELAELIAHDIANKDLQEYLGHIRQSGERARDLVAKMLAYSRQREGGNPQPVLLSTVIPELLKLLRPILPSSIIVNTELEQISEAVVVDMVELQQVVMNLCINARDAMDHEGKLKIAVRKTAVHDMVCTSCQLPCDGHYVELSVSDTGTGIKQETIDKIFEPFFTTKEVGKGSGMGLSMSHGIVHTRGGHIVVESELGKGTTFRLLFPVAEQQMAKAS